MNKIIVNEIFLSINGETASMGLPTTFIRLAGCNLSCWGGCDTEYAINQNNGVAMLLEEIIQRVKELECPRICLTGGEPLLNREKSIVLLESLAENGFEEVSVETNGSVDLGPFKEKLEGKIKYIMDLKPPSSGMDKKMHLENVKLLSDDDEVKFVIANKEDFVWAVEQINNLKPAAKILFSPLYGKVQPAELVGFVLDAKLWNSRVQLQLHKHIWPPETRGV